MVAGQELERPGPHRTFYSKQAPQEPSSRYCHAPQTIGLIAKLPKLYDTTIMNRHRDDASVEQARDTGGRGCPGKQCCPAWLAQFLETGQCLRSLWNSSASLTRPPEANDQPVGSGATSHLGWLLFSSARYQRQRSEVAKEDVACALRRGSRGGNGGERCHMVLALAWPGAVMLGNRYVSTSLPPRTATQVRRSTIFRITTPQQGDGQPETVGRWSATASFRHCCLIKWLSGNASLGFSRYWAGGGLYSTFGHQFALRRRKSSRRGRVYPATSA